MKINNPRSMVDFTRKPDDKENGLYNLATIGQLKSAIQKISDKFESFLGGTSQGTGFGNRGMASDNNFGYAWLNSEGKVDVSLLPPLAITEVHVIKQSDLVNDTLSSYVADNFQDLPFNTEVEKLLNGYIKKYGANLSFQKGDVVLVQPTVDYNSLESDIVDPRYSGSYIITAVPGDRVNTVVTDVYQFAKLAYTDSNIVKINDKVPVNSAGELQLFLRDILKMRSFQISGTVFGQSLAEALEDTVYRLVSIKENNDGNYRFAFKNNDGTVDTYAKKEELDDVSEVLDKRYTELTGVISDLDKQLHKELYATSSVLSSDFTNQLLATSSILTGKVSYISSTIGDRTMLPSRELSSTIFSQIMELRNNVDDNLELLNKSRCNTNHYLDLIHENVRNLHTNLNENAVKIYQKDIEMGNISGGLVTVKTIEYTSDIYATNNDVKGEIQWIYSYEPEADIPLVSGNSQPQQEKILAVFDENGNQIYPDIVRKKEQLTNGMWGYDIIISTEWYGDKDYTSSLIGTKFSLIIARTIVNIPFKEPANINFAVGGDLDCNHN